MDRTFKLKQPVVSLVATLLKACRPAAICRRHSRFAVIALSAIVSSIVVNSFDSVVWGWSSSHVSKELGKRITPSLAHKNTTSTIAIESIVGLIVTSPFHRTPGAMLRAEGLSVSRGSLATKFDIEASTTFSGSCDKLICEYITNSSACALACPSPVSSRIGFGKTNDRPPREFVFGLNVPTGFGTLTYSHDASPKSRLVRTAWMQRTSRPFAYYDKRNSP